MTRPHFAFPVGMFAPFRPHGALPWWQFRKRAARLRFLETVALMEIRTALDGCDTLSTTVEHAFLLARYGASAEGRQGADSLPILEFGMVDETGDTHVARVSLRLPLAVSL